MNIDWTVLIDHAVTWVFTVATPIVLYLLNKLIGKIAEKYHLDNVNSYQQVVDDVVIKAIQSVEAEALNLAASNKTVLTIEQKIQSAITLVTDELTHLQLPVPPAAQIAMRVAPKLCK